MQKYAIRLCEFLSKKCLSLVFSLVFSLVSLSYHIKNIRRPSFAKSLITCSNLLYIHFQKLIFVASRSTASHIKSNTKAQGTELNYNLLCCQTSIMSCILLFLFCLRSKFN